MHVFFAVLPWLTFLLRRLFLLPSVALALAMFGPVYSVLAGSACTGAADCTACSNCTHCRFCAKEGGTCGVKALRQAESPAVSPTAASTTIPGTAASAVPLVPVSATVGQPADTTVYLCIQAIASQSDPTKLATLGSRQTNPRLKRIMYYLVTAREAKADPGEVIDQAQRMNGSFSTPRAALVKAGLLRNLKICDGLGLLTPENLELLKRGNAPIVTRGPYTGQKAEVDHIVPKAQSPETDNELANLEMLPATLNRAKSDKIGERQLALARRFKDAGLISEATWANVQAKFVPSGTGKYELQEQ